jgi:hypothetical protein
MVIFERSIEPYIQSRLFKGRAVLIFGPRQAGKTTLAKKVLEPFGDAGAYFNCELATVRKHFVPGEPAMLRELVGGKKIVVFDEAQTIEDIGVILKVFLDTYPEVQVIATGSSSFALANRVNEPLTGRAFECTLFPLSLTEIRKAYPALGMSELHEYLRLGTYPAVVAAEGASLREDILKNIATNYLYQDVFTFESVKNPRVFESLVQLLALQAGSLVSINELSRELGISRPTVNKYLRLLEQSYVVTVMQPFSRNPRNEIKKAFKVFFVDVGVRNAVIDNVRAVSERADRGALFENFFVNERIKKGALEPFGPSLMFWRNRAGLEIDVVEESGGRIEAYECKWSAPINALPAFVAFLKAYPKATARVVTPEDLIV